MSEVAPVRPLPRRQAIALAAVVVLCIVVCLVWSGRLLVKDMLAERRTRAQVRYVTALETALVEIRSKPQASAAVLVPILYAPTTDFGAQLRIATALLNNGIPDVRAFVHKELQVAQGERFRAVAAELARVAWARGATEPWLMEEGVAILDNAELPPDTVRQLCSCCGYLKVKVAGAGPKLLAIVRRSAWMDTQDYTLAEAIGALGPVNYREAIPCLLKLLQWRVHRLTHDGERGPRFGTYQERALVSALVTMRVPEAVPLVMKLVSDPEMIHQLRLAGDKRAVPLLQGIVTRQGDLPPDAVVAGAPPPGAPWNPAERLLAARFALAALDDPDPVIPLSHFMHDQSLPVHERERIVDHFRLNPEPRAVPALVHNILQDPDGGMVWRSIQALGEYKTKTAVRALIVGFDADFSKTTSPFPCDDATGVFRESIGEALQRITGEKFGVDKAKWRDWWNSIGWHREDLK